jgi:hypothetical protein
MSDLRHERRFRDFRGTSAYPPRLAVKADIPDRQVRARTGLMQYSKTVPFAPSRAIFDDRGRRMSPSHFRKRAIKYRYYLSSALLQGRPKQAGTVSRIPAREVETLIANAVRNHLRQPTEIEDTVLINTHVVRVEVQPDPRYRTCRYRGCEIQTGAKNTATCAR